MNHSSIEVPKVYITFDKIKKKKQFILIFLLHFNTKPFFIPIGTPLSIQISFSLNQKSSFLNFYSRYIFL